MIKIKLRRNLLYLFVYYITWIINVFLERIFEFHEFIYLYLTIIGKIFGGLITYLYQYHFLKRNKQAKYFGINLIYNKGKTRTKDSKAKIGFLIFFASFFYVFKFMTIFQFAFYIRHSPSREFLLSSIQTVSSSLICTYALGFEMKKHHKVSLVVISLFLVLMFIVDIFITSKSMNFIQFFYFYLLIFYYHICETFSSCIEKYLVDINYLNPFLILMIEGIFELILATIYIYSFINKYILYDLKYFLYYTRYYLLLVTLVPICYCLISSISNV